MDHDQAAIEGQSQSNGARPPMETLNAPHPGPTLQAAEGLKLPAASNEPFIEPRPLGSGCPVPLPDGRGSTRECLADGRAAHVAAETRAVAPLPGAPPRAGEGVCSAENSQGDVQTVADEPPIRVMALHAMLYCERLFYLEEVEEIRVADAAVYAGRRLHVDDVDAPR